MNKKNTQKLFKDFPEFWKHIEDLSQSLMSFGFPGDGWFDLIYKLCKDIQKILDAQPEFKKNFYVTQVKEKFGGLRFYFSAGSDEIYDLTNKAGKESFKICEICGDKGKCRCKNHWYSTLCTQHWKEWQNKDSMCDLTKP